MEATDGQIDPPDRHFASTTDDGRYRLLIESVTDYAIYMLDADGHVSTWNKGAERIKGYRAEEVIGQHYSIFFTEADRAKGLPERALEIAAQEGRYESEALRVEIIRAEAIQPNLADAERAGQVHEVRHHLRHAVILVDGNRPKSYVLAACCQHVTHQSVPRRLCRFVNVVLPAFAMRGPAFAPPAAPHGCRSGMP